MEEVAIPRLQTVQTAPQPLYMYLRGEQPRSKPKRPNFYIQNLFKQNGEPIRHKARHVSGDENFEDSELSSIHRSQMNFGVFVPD